MGSAMQAQGMADGLAERAPAVRKVRRRGDSADLKTLHSSGMSPVSMTAGSSGRGTLTCASSLHCPYSPTMRLSCSALLAAVPCRDITATVSRR